MIKLAIPAVVGLLLGLGISTGAVVFMSGGASLGEDLETAMVDEHGDTIHAAADSTHAGESAAADTAHAEEAHGAEGQAELAAASGLTASAAEGMLEETPGSEAARALETLQPAPSGGMSTSQLADLYGTMAPREAAKVLEHMEDDEVQVILAGLDNRKAAAILSNLSPERAAIVSRSVIRGERSTN